MTNKLEMTNKEAIQIIEERYSSGNLPSKEKKAFGKAIKALKAIENISAFIESMEIHYEEKPSKGKNPDRASDDTESKWILCSKKPPDENKDVILQFENNMCVGFRTGEIWNINTENGFYTEIGAEEKQPVAWTSLPPSYIKMENHDK